MIVVDTYQETLIMIMRVKNMSNNVRSLLNEIGKRTTIYLYLKFKIIISVDMCNLIIWLYIFLF